MCCIFVDVLHLKLTGCEFTRKIDRCQNAASFFQKGMHQWSLAKAFRNTSIDNFTDSTVISLLETNSKTIDHLYAISKTTPRVLRQIIYSAVRKVSPPLISLPKFPTRKKLCVCARARVCLGVRMCDCEPYASFYQVVQSDVIRNQSATSCVLKDPSLLTELTLSMRHI